MANKSDGSGFDWDTLWSVWRNQPSNMQNAWMFGKGGLLPALKDVMVNYPKDVQDEMFAHAPNDVKKYFGYKSKDDTSAKGKTQKSYNDEYRSALLEKIRGLA